ncbi:MULTISPECIES: FAD:protein FMN transferase [unclassified Pantoea]|uniref:FAD:protein FMN transferase n=1 Tax=unclassified Pantoea TaxID=2630326 RepID=UPI0024778053|nr:MULTISPECIES: FAD:protein FMN transferase [unclassified Pantoea]GME41545.1 FAD:protein FMN transferase [Pantoea sp. QMID3]GME42438.1 FAD:protein FMN transferase [Pantoea sp. QMID1]GME57590.1 FAD:protein FMN transferase [Pantoea sp. QMID4]GME58124.1 FAD:protein FMN transferase [Pantoea sp. QMID2]
MLTDARVYAYSAVLMGSPILLKLFEDSQTLAGQVFRLIRQQENLFTVNRPASEVMAINNAAGEHAVVVSQPVFDLIACAHAVSLLPDSLFNLAIGPLVKCWKIGFQGHSVPSEADLQARMTLINPQDVILDVATRSVMLARPGMEIDLGAIAKGYIADVVQTFLRQQQVSSALINLGGNVHTVGVPPEEAGWAIGLKKPFGEADALIGVIGVNNRSVVTSGIYERYFELDAVCYHHILDPKTGYPLDNELLSVTVISDRSLDGDIYTTLLYGLGVEKGIACLADKPGIEAIFVTRDRQIICSSQRHFSFQLLDTDYSLVH